jgi:hypothetical protein
VHEIRICELAREPLGEHGAVIADPSACACEQPVGIVPLSTVTGTGMQLLLAAAGSAAPRRDVSAQPASAAAAGT